MTAKRADLTPPEHLAEKVRAVWEDIVARGRLAPHIDPAMLETYSTLVARWREVAEQLAEDGIVVDGGEKRGAVVHPALAAERQLAEQIREWSPLFNRPPAARRKSGPLYDATKKSIAAAELDKDDRFLGACEGVLTLAWLIDEAQRAGLEALQKASFVMIPSYLKGCADLQITPGSMPEELRKKVKAGGKVNKFQASAAARRNLHAV